MTELSADQAAHWEALYRRAQSIADSQQAQLHALTQELARRCGNEALLLSFIAPAQRATAQRLLSTPPAIRRCTRADERTVGYMCKTDYECELGAAAGGVRVHPSLDDLNAQRSCLAECGIVQVRVHLEAIVQESDYSHLAPPDPPQFDDNAEQDAV